MLFTTEHNQQQYVQSRRTREKRRRQYTTASSSKELSYLTHIPQAGDRHPNAPGGYRMEYMQNADTTDCDLTQSTEQGYEVSKHLCEFSYPYTYTSMN